MIKPKLKICSNCGDPCVLWQSVPKLCKDCSQRLKSASIAKIKPLAQTANGKTAKPFKAILKISDKQAKLNAAYSAQRKVFLKHRPYCEIKAEGCTGMATDVHHVKSRGKMLLDETEWKATCRACHDKIHREHQWAVDNGFIKSKLSV